MTIDTIIHARAAYQPMNGLIELWVSATSKGALRTVYSVPKETIWEDIEEGIGIPAPMLKLDRKRAGELMDDLWAAGIRPSIAQAGSEVVAAKQQHIDQLWALVDRLVSHRKGKQ